MNSLLSQDRELYKAALAETGGAFGGIEPVHRLYEAFQEPLGAASAAAAVGLETDAFLDEIREKSSLQNLGLAGLLRGGNVKRDVYESNFSDIISALQSEDVPRGTTRVVSTPTPLTPTGSVHIPDVNLRAAISETLGKAPGAPITSADMERLTQVVADERSIRNLNGLEYATDLERIEFRHNAISDLSPLAGLVRLNNIKLRGNRIRDVSPLANLINVDWLGLEENEITDLSPLSGLVKLNGIGIEGNPISDVSPLAGMLSLEHIRAWNTGITDFSALAKLPRLRWIQFSSNAPISELPSVKGLKTLRTLEINHTNISDISGLSELTRLTSLTLSDNLIEDVSPLANLKNLTYLHLGNNVIEDVSPLAGLNKLEHLILHDNAISDFSPLRGLADKVSVRARNNPGHFLQGGPKITGPWLWVIASTGERSGSRAAASGIDFLDQMSKGTVTELKIATNGATEGNPVGDSQWTLHKLSATGDNNLNDMANATGLGSGDINHHVAYGSIVLDSPRKQETKMQVGSDDAIKVWINGQLVHYNPVERWAGDYQDKFSVTLKEGLNVLLVAVYETRGGWSGFFGFVAGTEYTVLLQGSKFSLSTETTQIDVGATFTVSLKTVDITDLAGWQGDIVFDPAVLKATSVSGGSFLKQGGGQIFFRKGTIENKQGRITGIKAVRVSKGGVSGEGLLLSVKFTAKAAGETRLLLRNFQAGASTGATLPSPPIETYIVVGGADASASPAWDVNEDGITDAKDVTLVTLSLGQAPPVNPRTDVNGDGIVDGDDIAIVAAHLGEQNAPAAPLNAALLLGFTFENVEQTLDILHAADDGSLTFRRGIANLEHLLATFVPEETVLLPNYPNPFNPETWFPYQLAEASDVTLHIYAANGVLIHRLDIGHQPAGIYQHRSRAAYWDGKNAVGEPVASGVYFYTLTAGDFTATRKMLIRK